MVVWLACCIADMSLLIHKRARMYLQWNEHWPVYHVCGSCLLNSWMAPAVFVFECDGNSLLPSLAVWIIRYCWTGVCIYKMVLSFEETGAIEWRGVCVCVLNLGWVFSKGPELKDHDTVTIFCGRLQQDSTPPLVWNKSVVWGGVWLHAFFCSLWSLLACCCLRIFQCTMPYWASVLIQHRLALWSIHSMLRDVWLL